MGCSRIGPTIATRLDGGEYSLPNQSQAAEKSTRRKFSSGFVPTSIASVGASRFAARRMRQARLTPISIGFRWMEPQNARFWTAWQDTVNSKVGPWSDPLVPQPFVGRTYSYGQASVDRDGGQTWLNGSVITLPLASVLLPAHDLGVSLVESPCDTTLDMIVDDRR